MKLFIHLIINIKGNNPEAYYRLAKKNGRLFFIQRYK